MANDMAGMNIREQLSGVSFPAQKQDVINFAKSKNMPKEVISALNGIPDREYTDIEDLAKEVEMKMR